MPSSSALQWNEQQSVLEARSPVLLAASRLLKERLGRLLENGGRGMSSEYDRLRASGGGGSGGMMPQSSLEACSRNNSCKNRYLNIVPYDFNRVRLQGGGSDYVNASIVDSSQSELPCWSFIAAQGPLRSTLEDFWKMVFQQKCTAVVMLTRVLEKMHEKCAAYYPEGQGESCAFGDFEVTVEMVQDISLDITVRYLRITQLSTGAVTNLSHYHYHEWPDHGVPEYTRPIRDLINMLEKSGASQGKILVHCSAGVGRTGTFCAVHIVLNRLRYLQNMKDVTQEKLEWAINLVALVGMLRSQRMGMVQTIDQYYFCYQAVIQELDSVVKRGG